jgi:hypothetical protein
MNMNGYNNKYGAYPTKEDKRMDAIAGARKYLKIGMYDMVYLREKELHEVYGMTYSEIEKAIYA